MNNPPAFPSIDKTHYEYGMTLRDYFAAKAMAAKIASNEAWNDDRRRDGNPVRITPEETAAACYELADAMLAEREKAEPSKRPEHPATQPANLAPALLAAMSGGATA